MSECRICKETTNDPGNPLISPCNCTGSVGKVHRNCVEQWVQTSGNDKCRLCNSPFTQRVEYNGRVPRGLVLYLIGRENALNSRVGAVTLLFTVGTLFGAVFNGLWGYFITSRLTCTKLAVYNAFSYGIFAGLGLLVGIGRQITFRFNNTEHRFDGTNLALPVLNLLTVIEFIVATHHVKHTGWVFPVILMYYTAAYKLGSTILFKDFLGWYCKQYFKRIFINNPEQGQRADP